jgi:multimeric flavodoxin WrbA
MSSRKIIIVEGSPRPSGNSALLARAVASGARSVGAEVETLQLHKMDIRPCNACDACQESLEKDCIIDDAMKDVYPRLRAANAIVYASPIYWFTVSGQMKLFMDRCYALTFLGTLPGIDGSETVEVLQTDLGGKKFGVVLSYGDIDPYASGAVNAIRTFQDMARFVGSEMTGLVYGSAIAPGEVAENNALMSQAYDLGRALAADAR